MSDRGHVVWEDGEGEHFSARGSDMWFKALGATTNGRFSLMQRTMPPGAGAPPPHRHPGHEEGFYVLDGVVTFTVGDEVFEAGPRSFVLVPAGAAHTFGNTGTQPAALLVLHAPALDAYFADLHRLWTAAAPGEPSRSDEVAVMRRHSIVPL